MIYRTHTLDQIDEDLIGEDVIVSGWVNSTRDHGGVIFVDLRDRFGKVQIKGDPQTTPEDIMNIFKRLKDEYVIKVKGKVVPRPKGTENLEIKSGKVEIVPEEVQILSEARHLPFEVAKEHPVGEDIRMKYRYIDLRRPSMQNNIIQRHKILYRIFNFLSDNDFVHIETPYLIKNTPEGAREFIVPSRFYPGKGYVLPQSPQQLKQILMVAGFDKYFQIARCFRDEDLRGDRQPEFTQIDIEMSFVNADDVMKVVEDMLLYVMESLYSHKQIVRKIFPRLTWKEVMDKWGSDKPELRYDGMQIVDVSDIAFQSDFRVFRDVVKGGGVVKCILVNKIFTRGEIDRFTKLIQEKGAKGLAYIVFENGQVKSPILKFFDEDLQLKLFSRLNSKNYSNLEEALKDLEGKTAFFQATDWYKSVKILGFLRSMLIKDLNLLEGKEDHLCFLWVTDFPMFEFDEETGEVGAMHHPFTKPKDEYIDFIKHVGKQILDFRKQTGKSANEFFRKNPDILKKVLEVKADSYDIVLNGYEIGGGSIRITDPELQTAIFEILGLSPQQIEERFGHMIEAFKYGVPPHGGLAIGFDRLVMILQNEKNIRQVIAFPKTQRGEDLMLKVPSELDEQLLKELGLQVKVGDS